MEILKEMLGMEDVSEIKNLISKWYILYELTDDYDLSLLYLKLKDNSSYVYMGEVTKHTYLEFRSSFLMRNLCPYIETQNPNIEDSQLKIGLYIKKSEVDTTHKRKSVNDLISYIKSKALQEEMIFWV